MCEFGVSVLMKYDGKLVLVTSVYIPPQTSKYAVKRYGECLDDVLFGVL